MATVRFLISPKTSGLTDVVVDCYDETNTFIQTVSLTEIGTTGVYANTVPQNSSWGIVYSVSANVYDLVRISPNLTELAATLTTLRDIELGAWKIQGSQMIFYDTTGTKVVATFNLLDATGNPTTSPSSAVQRVPV